MRKMTTGRRSDSKATRDFWARINREDRAADARGNGRPDRAPDPMTLCNSCDAAPALPTSVAGYCAKCMDGLSETEKRWLWGDQ